MSGFLVKTLAVIVLAIAAFVLLHAVIGLIGAVIKIAILVAAIIGVIWAWRTLRASRNPQPNSPDSMRS